MLFNTQNPAYLAAPVRLELTTHGLTAIKTNFQRAESLYFQGFQRINFYTKIYTKKFYI